MYRVYRRAAARRDLVEHYVYLAESAGEDIAESFLMRAEATFLTLAEHPKMGSPLQLRNPRLAELRKWRVQEFENFLVFYVPRSNGVSLVRVLYATQDWWGVLGLI